MSQTYASEDSGMRRRSQSEKTKAMVYLAMLIGSDVHFAEAQTSWPQELRTGAEDAVPASQPAYSTGARSATYSGYSGSMYPSGSSHQPGPSYPSTRGYVTPGHLDSVRPSTNDSNYTYGYEYDNLAPTYPSAGEYRDPREGARTYSSYADPRDNSFDLRDFRIDQKDPRLDTRPDPRPILSFPSDVSSPGDVSMTGAVDDPRAYDYMSLVPPLLSDKGGSSTPYGAVPRGSVPKLHSKEDLLQPSTETPDATPDEESEWSGITSSDDDAVR